jgi:hypothetical protein
MHIVQVILIKKVNISYNTALFKSKQQNQQSVC